MIAIWLWTIGIGMVFFCVAAIPVEATAFTLTVSMSDVALGSVISRPEGISCPANHPRPGFISDVKCTAAFAAGTIVTLTARNLYEDNAPTGLFGKWTGDCAVAGTNRVCAILMNSDKQVGASYGFGVGSGGFAIGTSVVGNGSVTSGPPGNLDCPAFVCYSFFLTTATLTAHPDPGSKLNGWSGACSGTGSCVVPSPGPFGGVIKVTATFEAKEGVDLNNGGLFNRGDTILYEATVPLSYSGNVDIYLGALLPDRRTFLSLIQNGSTITTSVGVTPVPFLRNAVLPLATVQFTYTLAGREPIGDYVTYAVAAIPNRDPLVSSNRVSTYLKGLQIVP